MEPTAEQRRAQDVFDRRESMVVEAGAGCLAGDTVLNINRGGKGSSIKIGKAAAQFSGGGYVMERALNGRTVAQRARGWDLSIPTRIARGQDDVVKLGEVADMWYSGVKQTFTLMTDKGRAIRATSEHPFLTADGDFRQLGLLRMGDGLQVNAGRSAAGRGPKPIYRYRATRFHPHQTRDTNKREKFKVPAHRLVVEAEMNGLSLDAYIKVLRTDPELSATLIFLSPDVDVHHEDHDTLNNDPANLVVLDGAEHARHHGHGAAGDNVLWHLGIERVESVIPFGVEPTYDVEVTDDPHNFLANGFVVHNTGKTTTLRMLAESAPDRSMRYVAFNKAIVVEAGDKMPDNVVAKTAHSLAFGAMMKRPGGNAFKARLDGGRVRGDQIARQLGIEPFVVQYGDQAKVLQPGYIASLAQRSIKVFCNTADLVPSYRHVPYVDGIDVPTTKGERTYANNDKLAKIVGALLPGMWADLTSPTGTLPWARNHDIYLKMWELDSPRIDADVIMFDEAQDASPVMLSIVEQQADHAQLVFVGDSQQAIYEWRGAVNALENAPGGEENRTFLTQSFRFGPAVAEVANVLLEKCEAELRLVGTPSIDSVVGPVAKPVALLTRTNARGVKEVLDEQALGGNPLLLGGGTDVLAFARGADELQKTGRTNHADLACFDSWQQVLDYVRMDPQGDELALNVKLVEEYGVETIIEALARMPKREEDATLVVSTAHKAKGREWDSVKLANDFRLPEGANPDAEPSLPVGEWRLLYVACTRAKLALDVSAAQPVAMLLGICDDAEAVDGPAPAPVLRVVES